MTAVIRPADAPRAASIIISSSIRFSCTGATSGCTMNTSRWRQLVSSCASRQSLANRWMREGLRSTPSSAHISWANSTPAVPAKTAISFMG